MSNNIACKSLEAKEKVLAVYDKILANWLVPFESKFIETFFGKTHILISGGESFKPLVLLHGGGGNSSMWSYNIEELSQHFRVYMVDIIGEPGKSEEVRPLYHSDDYALWLAEVFAALNLDKAALGGASLGGFLASKFALKFPEKVSDLILLAPPSLLPMKASFIFQAIISTILPFKYFAYKFFKKVSVRARTIQDQQVFEDFLINWQSYKPNNNPIPVITNEELAKLPAKTLLIIGKDEELFDYQEVIDKVSKSAPSIHIKELANAGHVLSFDQPEEINKEIISFIS
jgi:pimeloyl-ACP methyl ester carboxylesterase